LKLRVFLPLAMAASFAHAGEADVVVRARHKPKGYASASLKVRLPDR